MHLISLCAVFGVLSIVSCYPKLNGRIVGGNAADISAFPFQLSLQYFQSHICGASIISASYGVTAAHCVSGMLQKGFSVTAGSNLHEQGGIRTKISLIKVHHLYDNQTTDYDIALIMFEIPLTFNSRALPVRLPLKSYTPAPGTIGYTTGWGYTKESDTKVSAKLMVVRIPVLRQSQCRQLYLTKAEVTPRMICAGPRGGGRDACQGDSGGPFTVNGVLIGIVSWGYGCARPGYPGVYTNVAELREWIKQHANV